MKKSRFSEEQIIGFLRQANASRLNPLRDLGKYRDHALVQQTREQIKQFGAAAVSNTMRLLSVQGAWHGPGERLAADGQ